MKADNGDSNNSRQEHDRAHDQWYAGLVLGAGVMVLAFVTLLIATSFLL
jgi:hypothetical protein